VDNANSEISFFPNTLCHGIRGIHRDQISTTHRLKIALTSDSRNKLTKLRLLLSLIAYRACCHIREELKIQLLRYSKSKGEPGIAAF